VPKTNKQTNPDESEQSTSPTGRFILHGKSSRSPSDRSQIWVQSLSARYGEEEKSAPFRKECGTRDLDGEMTELFWIMATYSDIAKEKSRRNYK
jgi:hypothetical protein